MNILKINANAKLNLGLQILNKREDGFHNINTIFTGTRLFDEIEIKPGKNLEISCSPSLNIPQEENIAFKAVRQFLDFYNITDTSFSISIKKNIPTGAGLGGGSSDAASVLLGLRKILNIPYNYRELHDISLKLGSDVPYFLKKGTAVGKGRGEKLSYFSYKLPYHILLVLPGLHVSTPWAYSSLERTLTPEKALDFKKILLQSVNEPEILKTEIFNDFEKTVFVQYPILKEIKEKLYSSNAVYAQMSGSGSTVFGLFRTNKEAEDSSLLFQGFNTFIC